MKGLGFSCSLDLTAASGTPAAGADWTAADAGLITRASVVFGTTSSIAISSSSSAPAPGKVEQDSGMSSRPALPFNGTSTTSAPELPAAAWPAAVLVPFPLGAAFAATLVEVDSPAPARVAACAAFCAQGEGFCFEK